MEKTMLKSYWSEDMTLKEKLQKMADEHGATLSAHADKIIAIKQRNIDEYACPCHPDDPEHYCMSQLCKTTLNTKGHCDCRLFIKDV